MELKTSLSTYLGRYVNINLIWLIFYKILDFWRVAPSKWEIYTSVVDYKPWEAGCWLMSDCWSQSWEHCVWHNAMKAKIGTLGIRSAKSECLSITKRILTTVQCWDNSFSQQQVTFHTENIFFLPSLSFSSWCEKYCKMI